MVFFKNVNAAVINKLGYSKDELFSQPISNFIHPEDKELTKIKRKDLLKGKALMNFDNRYVTKNGNVVWLHWTSVYVPEKEIVFAIAKDVTERKLSELAIEEKYKKFRNLATHFKMGLEKDKKHLAIELHEELAQLASVIKMDINWLKDKLPELEKETEKRLDNAAAVSQLLINSIRKLSYSISPNMIDDVGLNDTLDWLCQEFAVLNGIACFFESNIDDEKLPYEIKLDLYRICQEALDNVMYHANANMVHIKLEPAGEKISLSIIDDGKGFELNKLNHLPGLTAIRERVASVDGELMIESSLGNGTKIGVTI